MKRKHSSKEEPELTKKPRLAKNSKSKDSVFVALCSTLSQTVLPNKKTGDDINPREADGNESTGEENHQENDPAVSRSCSENSSSLDKETDREKEKEKEPASASASRNCSDCLHSSSDNRQLVGGGEDCSLIPSKTSPEMAVNGAF